MKRILLFDMHTDGHHLEYARKLQESLREITTESKVEVLTTEPSEQSREIFSKEDIQYLYRVPADRTAGFRMIRKNIRDDIVGDFIEYLRTEDYDLAHLLHTDDILTCMTRHISDREGLPKIVGSINGSLFRLHSPYRDFAAKKIINFGIEEMVGKISPDIISRRPPWNYIHLSRCISSGVFDHLFVATEKGSKKIRELHSDGGIDISVVPDPLELQPNSMTQEDARDEIEINSDNIFLFFGELRGEKGIEVLLSAIDMYEGPEATLIIAGRPKDISPSTIESFTSDKITVRTNFGYVPSEQVPLYFNAANAVILPYRRSFGQFRTSGVFQKACGYGCPVVVSDFGVLGRRTREWELGVTFTPGDSKELALALHRILKASSYNPQKMHEYAESQTYMGLAKRTLTVYESLCE